MSARASRSSSGCSGRWAGWGRWPGSSTTSSITPRRRLPYAIKRYADEVNRLYGVMNIRLKDREFLAGKYSIADMACVGWANLWERQGQDISQFPNLKRWLETVKARPAVQRGMALGRELRQGIDMKDPNVQAVLFGQRARTGEVMRPAIISGGAGLSVGALPGLALAQDRQHAAFDLRGIDALDLQVRL